MSTHVNEHAEALKAEGNTLFQAGEHRLAYRKYTEAIREDPKNAVYYSNRAACTICLKEFMDASSDARKATTLDPKYAKAWSRLATARSALSMYSSCIDAWKEALNSLPQGDQMSEEDKRLKIQFEQGLAKAIAARAKPQPAPMRAFGPKDKMPWTCAAGKVTRLKKNKVLSSALLIDGAYNDFKVGVDTMKMLHQQSMNGKSAWVGKPEALVHISNGMMMDIRAFHIDSSDWQDKYNKQVMFECEFFGAWKDEGPKEVIKAMPKRVAKDGWNGPKGARNALATTVRAWIMNGMLATSMHQQRTAVEYLARAMQVLKWGTQAYNDVHNHDRGCIFEPTFIRGVARQQITAIHAALASRTECAYSVDDLSNMCIDLIAEVDGTAPNPFDTIQGYQPSFVLSFWTYPHAEALTILGWCHTQRGLKAVKREEYLIEFAKAAEKYDEACSLFPEDDEKTATFLAVNLESYSSSNKPWNETKGLLRRLISSWQKVGGIWQNSPMAVDRNTHIAFALEFFEKCMLAEEAGTITDTSIVKPLAYKKTSRFSPPSTIYL